MNSLEKLEQALQGAGSIEPQDEETARMLQALQLVRPMIGSMIPDTAQRLDGQLLAIVEWLLELLSDNPAFLATKSFGEPLLLPNALESIRWLRAGVDEGKGYDVEGALEAAQS